MATYGDIHHTPFYDTTYQHAHGFNERHLQAKSDFWDREYQYHSPAARRVREKFVVKPGRDERGRTLGQDVQVGEVLQARTALLGSACDLSTRNSLRVATRHGESQRLGESEWPIPVRAQQTQNGTYYMNDRTSSIPPSELAARESWSLSTIPRDRTSSLKSSLRHPSARESSRAVEPWNSRQTSYDTEYTSVYSNTQTRGANSSTTSRSDFLARSLKAFEDPIRNATDDHVYKTLRPLSPTQPLIERQANERISQPGLYSMNRPVHRKIYPDLDENPIPFRPEPYNFDLTYHINRMRPTPLFKDVNVEGQRISESRTSRLPTVEHQFTTRSITNQSPMKSQPSANTAR